MSEIDFSKIPTSDQRRKQAYLTLAFYGSASLIIAGVGYAFNTTAASMCAVGAAFSLGKITDSYIESINNLKKLENKRKEYLDDLSGGGNSPTP